MARVIRADQQGPRRIPGAIVDATIEARVILERARQEAAAIHAQAQHQGREQARAELAAKLLELAQERDQRLRALEPQAIEVALIAAKRVIGEELRQRPELIGELVAPLFARLRRAHDLELRVHPDDRAALEQQLDALRAAAQLAPAVRIATDATLSRGSCIVVSDIGSLDARIETQLAALARALGAA